MRVAGFNRLTQVAGQNTTIDTKDVVPLAQPWMYLLLLLSILVLQMTDLGIGLLLWSSPPAGMN